MRDTVLVTIVAALGVVGAGCASSKPPPPKAAPKRVSRHHMVNPIADDDSSADGLQVSGLLGSLDQDAIQRGLAPQLPGVARCFDRQARRQPYLGGAIRMEYRVAVDGSIKKLLMSESTLGSFAVEQCIVEQMSKARFSRPHGGEAEFSYPLSFPARVVAKEWNPGMVSDEMTQQRDVLLGIKAMPDPPKAQRKRRSRRSRRARRRRKARAPAPVEVLEPLVPPPGLVITFYVDRKGQAISAGMVAAEPVEPEFAQKFIVNLKKLKFVGPESRYAKVKYQW